MTTTEVLGGVVPAVQLATLAHLPFPGESEAYSTARRALLAEEIDFRRHMTRVSALRRALELAGYSQRKWERHRAARVAQDSRQQHG